MEVISQENTDANSGFVVISSHNKGTTIWDYDRLVYDHFFYYEKSCFPVQCIGAHSCRPPSLILQIMKPVIYALMDKRLRTRAVVHNVPTNEILDALSTFGIMKDMLPTEMGGTIYLNQSEWMTARRAVEMEEI